MKDKVVKVIKEEYVRFVVIVVASVIYALGLAWFLQPGQLYSGGFVGAMQLVVNVIAKHTGEEYAIGLFIFIVNIPVLFIAFKFVSLKFALYSLLSILIQTVMGLGFIPIPDLQINMNVVGNPYYSQLMLALVGGGLIGFGGALALRYGGSTGGIDILAQWLALKKDFSIGVSCMIFNVCIALVGGLLLESWAIVFYTIVRIVVTSIVTDKVHTIYNNLKVEVITEKSDEMSSMIMKVCQRGVTIVNGQGAYTKSDKFVLEVVLSSYQLQQVTKLAKEIDEHAFIISTPVKNVHGNFKKRTIA